MHELKDKMMKKMPNKMWKNCVKTGPEMNISVCQQMVIAVMLLGKACVCSKIWIFIIILRSELYKQAG